MSTTTTTEFTRPTWDETWLAVADVISRRAACTRRQVGAVLVVANEYVWLGYNGTPGGTTHCTDGGCPRGLQSADECEPLSAYDNCTGLHAEMNASTRAGDRARGGTLYITCEPCDWCTKIARSLGVAKIVWPTSHIDLTGPVAA